MCFLQLHMTGPC